MQFAVQQITHKGRTLFAVVNASGKQVGKPYKTREGAERKLGKKASGKTA